MNEARNRILAALNEERRQDDGQALPPLYQPRHDWDMEQRIERLTHAMTAVRSEVIRLADADWMAWANRELPGRGLTRLLVGEHEAGKAFQAGAHDGLSVATYQHDVEQCKPMLFDSIDAGITGCRGAIADTGSLILWPDRAEPRLLSLAPPVHIALLQADRIFNTFADAMQAQDWNQSMPTNALLVSGPSKTADIEQTLAYGIHGPKQLIVLILG